MNDQAWKYQCGEAVTTIETIICHSSAAYHRGARMVGKCHLSGCQGYLHGAWHLLQRLGEPQCQGTLDSGTEPLDGLPDLADGHCWVRHIQPCVGCEGEGWCSDRIPLFQAAEA